MNKEDRFYIKELQPIRAFCLRSDKEDVYECIYSLQQENQQLKSVLNELREIVSKSLFKTDLVELCRMKNQIKDVLDKVGGSNE